MARIVRARFYKPEADEYKRMPRLVVGRQSWLQPAFRPAGVASVAMEEAG